MNLATTRDIKLIHEYSTKLGELLYSFGVDVNLAPVVDVNYEGRLSLIGTRTFSSDSNLVDQCSMTFILGQLEHKIYPVLKHWPGHGKVSKIPTGANENYDFHSYLEPLKVGTNLNLFKQPYNTLLENKTIKRFTAVMTSHLLVDDLRNKCLHGTKQRMITFCKKAIDDLRKDHNFDDGVVIADDMAYLKATSQHEKLYHKLRMSFEAGHDMVIIASMFPFYFQMPYRDSETYICDESQYKGENYFQELTQALTQLEADYSRNDKLEKELRKSVCRILKWKLGKKLFKKEQNKTTASVSFNDEIEHSKRLCKELKKIYHKVIENSIVLISPNINTFEVGRTIGIEKNSKILAIGPTMYNNDLKDYLDESNYENIIHKDLSYRDMDLIDPEVFIEKQAEDILRIIRRNKPEFVIFGLVNKPAHLDIWKKIHRRLKANAHPTKLILVAFHLPSIIDNNCFNSREDIVFATFSNQRYANKVFVNVLNGLQPHKKSDYLPVRINNFHDGIINPISNQEINEISTLLTQIAPSIIKNDEIGLGYTTRIKINDEPKVDKGMLAKEEKRKKVIFYIVSTISLLVSFFLIYRIIGAGLFLSIIIICVAGLIQFTSLDLVLEALSQKIIFLKECKFNNYPVLKGLIALVKPFIIFYGWFWISLKFQTMKQNSNNQSN